MSRHLFRAIWILVTNAIVMTEALHAQGTPRIPSMPTDAYTAKQVTKVAAPLSNNPAPKYPFVLKQAEIQGEVHVEFVVDETGRPDTSTFRVVDATQPLFGVAVKAVLPSMRFSPAERDGKKVKQILAMLVEFRLP